MASFWSGLAGKAAFTALLLGALAFLSDFTIGSLPDHGVIRLAWRLVSQRVSLCRQASAAELERLPQHMRRPTVCVDRLLPYALRVAVDGRPVLERRVSAPGAHGDRPLYVQEDLRAEPGPHTVVISFVPDEDAALKEVLGEGADAAWTEALRGALGRAARFDLDRVLPAAAGRVTLIQLHEREGRFFIMGP
jgi:hypothetical protein